jgi:hypothetical protein
MKRLHNTLIGRVFGQEYCLSIEGQRCVHQSTRRDRLLEQCKDPAKWDKVQKRLCQQQVSIIVGRVLCQDRQCVTGLERDIGICGTNSVAIWYLYSLYSLTTEDTRAKPPGERDDTGIGVDTMV